REVKPDHVGREHAAQEFDPPGADAEDVRVRPGNVPEQEDAYVGPGGLDHARNEGELIVLDEDDRITGADRVEDGVGEPLVDADVGLPVGRSEDRPLVDEETKWPEGFVGAA